MGATEVIEQAKALPASEQILFAEWFHRWEARGNGGSRKPSPFQLPDYAGRLRQLLPDGPIEGDPQQFWAELRSDFEQVRRYELSVLALYGGCQHCRSPALPALRQRASAV